MKALFLVIILLATIFFSCRDKSNAQYVPPSNFRYIQHYELNGSTYIDEFEIDSVRYLTTIYMGVSATTIKK